MKTKGVVAVIVAALVFGAGWEAASVRFERDIAVERQQFAERTKVLEETYREKERQQSTKLAEAWSEVDRARADADALRTASARMQFELSEANRRLSESARHSGDACTQRLAECVCFVQRFDEIAGRSVGLAQDIAVKKDAIVKITQ